MTREHRLPAAGAPVSRQAVGPFPVVSSFAVVSLAGSMMELEAGLAIHLRV